ncbi:magnesium transporter CorA family protein [Candidatus Formimonas warabiya]|uniref:Magnesium transporter n=1 Tax=Formimonas warabiya TaxID=1761012 RepID=A0A3G1L1L3_FORW1|nr:magnesium transporter CorA family protein [Candidatus Formimonas warabiya]ATW28534.1 magnesium transporter [Candidatus Formimonas warabiya]
MLIIRKTLDDGTTLLWDKIEKGVWINLVDPTEAEINKVEQETGISYDFLRYPLDEEERPRVEFDDDQMLAIFDVPRFIQHDSYYDTIPLGIIVTGGFFVTICLDQVSVLDDFCTGNHKGSATYKKTRFLFLILYKTATLYLKYLREINKKSEEIELELHKSLKNKELIRLLNLQKSLVYFTTSLRSNRVAAEKLVHTSFLEKFSEDEDLIEDVIIENQQALDMAHIFTNILNGTMDAFASIISNNLNIVMKFLAAVTIIISLPTMVASFFGMNVGIPFQNTAYGFFAVIVISIFVSALGALFLLKKGML